MAAAKRTGPRNATASSRKEGSGRRKTLNAGNATFTPGATARDQFKELDEKGRALKADRRVKAKTRTKPGYGDRGDRAA